MSAMHLDAHIHFWRYERESYPWIRPEWPIKRDFLPGDAEPLFKACGMDGCIAVQARQSLEETRWLLQLADTFSSVKGVVGWVDLCSPAVADQLEEFANHPKLVGVRHVVQDEKDERFMLRKDFLDGISVLESFGLGYDILIYPHQLAAAVGLARHFPGQRFVVDHMAKPPIRDQVVSPWREQIRELAALPNVMCKVSGIVTEASWHSWCQNDLSPYLDVVFDAFGPTRLMFGSDWPVALLAADYRQVFEVAEKFVDEWCPGERENIFGRNAARFYGL